MTIVTLPTGFTLDLDDVSFVSDAYRIHHPFVCFNDEYIQQIHCKSLATIELYVTEAQSKEIQNIINAHLNKQKGE